MNEALPSGEGLARTGLSPARRGYCGIQSLGQVSRYWLIAEFGAGAGQRNWS